LKLIVSLRDPVDRAYSSYLGRLRGGSERCSVEEAMRPGSYYFETSLYFPRLSRYLARFGEERIKVILFDDLEEDASGVLHELFEFLGVDPAFAPDVSVRHNSARVPRSIALNELLLRTAAAFHRAAPRLRGSGLISRAQELLLRRAGPLDPAIRRRLRAQFRDDTLRTAQLIGRDLSRWLEKD
jgi:hypothetical protein